MSSEEWQAGKPRWNQQVTLPDGRRLGFAEYGAAAGETVLYFHGWPGSRVEPQAVESTKGNLGVRVIAVDRPGYGLSDFQEHRAILDWPADISRLADALGLGRFAVMGVSGGGPYAAVCAAKLPDRVNAAALVCAVRPLDQPGATAGMASHDRWLLGFARTFPWLAREAVGLSLRWFWDYEHEVLPKALLENLPPADREVIAQPELRDMLLADWREAFRHGREGMVWDGNLYAWPWGFRLEETKVPVQLWQGEADTIVPPSMGRYLASVIPSCQARFCPGEGHFSLPFRRTREILDALVWP
jgi:pimeloyl-ACP methyl ester carboxylesterase